VRRPGAAFESDKAAASRRTPKRCAQHQAFSCVIGCAPGRMRDCFENSLGARASRPPWPGNCENRTNCAPDARAPGAPTSQSIFKRQWVRHRRMRDCSRGCRSAFPPFMSVSNKVPDPVPPGRWRISPPPARRLQREPIATLNVCKSGRGSCIMRRVRANPEPKEKTDGRRRRREVPASR